MPEHTISPGPSGTSGLFCSVFRTRTGIPKVDIFRICPPKSVGICVSSLGFVGSLFFNEQWTSHSRKDFNRNVSQLKIPERSTSCVVGVYYWGPPMKANFNIPSSFVSLFGIRSLEAFNNIKFLEFFNSFRFGISQLNYPKTHITLQNLLTHRKISKTLWEQFKLEKYDGESNFRIEKLKYMEWKISLLIWKLLARILFIVLIKVLQVLRVTSKGLQITRYQNLNTLPPNEWSTIDGDCRFRLAVGDQRSYSVVILWNRKIS